MDKPVVAGIHSYCLGGGVQIALGCDIRVCTPDSIFGLTAVKECLVPSLGVWRLPRYIGLGRAKRMVMTGENISAQEALEFGLVDFVVDDLEAKLTELCTVFTRVARTSFRHSKRLTNLAFDYDHDTMLADFIEAEMECVNSPENVEAMAAWREKREPNFA
jgi:enoyl-CoA hydratase/carnithine racemase